MTTVTQTVVEQLPLLSDDMDDSMLTELDKEYTQLSASVSRSISQLKSADEKKIREIIDNIKVELDSCRTALREMRQEVRALDGNSRSKWNNAIERYQNDYQALKDQYEKEKQKAMKRDVFAGAYDPANVGSSHEQARMLKMRNQSKDNTMVLTDARKELGDIEMNAIDIQENLYTQRGTIERIRDKLASGNTMLGRMGRVISRMTRRQALMRVMWCLVILILLTVIGVVIYLKVK